MEAPRNDYIYDLETYKDVFLCGVIHVPTSTRYIFEVSDRIDQSREVVAFLYYLAESGATMVGYNNLGFDYPILHTLLQMPGFSAHDAYTKAQNIIQSDDRFSHLIWEDQRLIPQVDLFKIHHFDNRVKSTSLKRLSINMQAANVVDLPYDPHVETTGQMRDELTAYMCSDIARTLQFYHHTLPMIRFREDIKSRYPEMGDVVNMNDTAIGKKFFITSLEKAGIACYRRVDGKREPVQTHRDQIKVADIILPHIRLHDPELNRVLDWFKGAQVRPWHINGFISDLSASFAGLDVHFGLGGIHASVNSRAIREDDEWEIWDWDVASYYPNLAIRNRLHPAHLSDSFCEIYQSLYTARAGYAKNTSENAMYKLALNGVYGDSGNEYSPFYDPQYMLSITVNGQLLLCMLAEMIDAQRDDMELIQMNTDGLTVRVRKGTAVERMHEGCKAWAEKTGLVLESNRYKSMFVRDVNNYIAVHHSGKIKRLGRYAYETAAENPATRELAWHKDHSSRVVAMAAEAQMVHGEPVEDFIRRCGDPFLFLKSVKVNRNSLLTLDGDVMQRTSRYYVSTSGGYMRKEMNGRVSSIEKGWRVKVCNDISHFDWSDLNRLYYIREARKLLI